MRKNDKRTTNVALKHFLSIIISSLLIALPLISGAADGKTEYSAGDLTQGQENIVRRARQVLEIEWTAQENIVAWEGYSEFKAGETYQGIPYGMPNNAKNYVPYGTSFDVFLEAVSDTESLMYTSFSTRTSIAPYYSLDCSAFISWVWNLEELHKTWDLVLVASRVYSLDNIEVGDVLNKSADHVVLIYSVEYDDTGNIARVGIAESAPPIAKLTFYGQGEKLPLSMINDIYIDDDYIILRYAERDSVEYVHNCLIPIDNDFCSLCVIQNTVGISKLLDALTSRQEKMQIK